MKFTVKVFGCGMLSGFGIGLLLPPTHLKIEAIMLVIGGVWLAFSIIVDLVRQKRREARRRNKDKALTLTRETLGRLEREVWTPRSSGDAQPQEEGEWRPHDSRRRLSYRPC